jgi:deoxyribodipyrimidine photo-lyase
MTGPCHLFWFRRDLRLHDNKGLVKALQSGLPVLPLFIFDTAILDELEDRRDRRVTFIYQAIERLKAELEKLGTTLLVRYGKPEEIYRELVEEFPIKAVFTNRDYEPYARERDQRIMEFLEQKGIPFRGAKDIVVWEKNEIVKDNGQPYTVFSPYSKKWLSLFRQQSPAITSIEGLEKNFLRLEPLPLLPLSSMDFEPSGDVFLPPGIEANILRDYHLYRDLPGITGTSRLGVHLRFGTVSIRQLALEASRHSDKFLAELTWREFFTQLMWHQPRLVSECCKPAFERIQWRNDEKEFERWCRGQTGYPVVDAGMRELNATGFMHNRIRMVTASFLVKHLLIDWRWGEAYFASKLLDYELASNNGNWQWVTGCGCEAAPYFRIFNPYTQAKKFDPDDVYISKWVPEWNTPQYVEPIIEHVFARERCLRTYKVVSGEPNR